MQPHLKLEAGQISPYVLTCGDPARADQIAKLCEKPRELAYNREYRSFNGRFDGENVTVVSHGVGSAGAAICFEELIKIGARVIIRVGTCGTLRDDLDQGDQIVVTAAVREDGVSSLLIPAGYPAVADSKISDALEKYCVAEKSPFKKGIVLASDCFYPGILPTSLEMYSKANVVGVEMECSTLFVIASLRGIKAGSILTVDGNPLKWEEGNYDPHGKKVTEGKKRMLILALKAVADLSRAKSA